MDIRKGDVVQVIAGDARDHGRRGKVLNVDRKNQRVLVEGINLIKKHTKPSSQNQQGGIVEKEGPIHISNVMPYCESAGRPSPIRRKTLDDGRRVRVYKINGETLKDRD